MKNLKFMHFRSFKATKGMQEKGGLTIAYAVDTRNKAICFSQAMCSRNDNFNKKIGRNVAQGRFDHGFTNYVIFDSSPEAALLKVFGSKKLRPLHMAED